MRKTKPLTLKEYGGIPIPSYQDIILKHTKMEDEKNDFTDVGIAISGNWVVVEFGANY